MHIRLSDRKNLLFEPNIEENVKDISLEAKIQNDEQ